jgi:hypothetical protein
MNLCSFWPIFSLRVFARREPLSGFTIGASFLPLATDFCHRRMVKKVFAAAGTLKAGEAIYHSPIEQLAIAADAMYGFGATRGARKWLGNL